MATIYKITSTAGDKVYIGSTTQTLEDRWLDHKDYRNIERKYNSKILFDEYGIETCSLEEIEKVDLDKRYERERFWIENTEHCVNRFVPGRTYSEWYAKNKKVVCAKVKERRLGRIICPTCGKNLAKCSFSRHKKLHLSKVNIIST
jgi:hypothetical protein